MTLARIRSLRVQRADQPPGVVDDQHAGDAVLSPSARPPRPPARRRGSAAARVHHLAGAQAAQVGAGLDQAAQVAVGEDAERPGRRRRRRRWRPGPCASSRAASRCTRVLGPTRGTRVAGAHHVADVRQQLAARGCRPGASARSPPRESRARRAAPRPARRRAPSARWCWRSARGSAGRPPVDRAVERRCRHGAPASLSAPPVIATSVTPSRLITGRMALISSLSPELEIASTRSPGVTMPRSPWLASAGWTNIAGVPVEASVAAILRPTWPLLPMPMTTTRPRQASIACTRGDEAFALTRLQASSASRLDVEGARGASSSTRSASKADGAGTGCVAKASSRIGRF